MGQRILVVDDSRTVCRVIQWVFHASPTEVQVVHTGDEAMRAISASRPDVAIVDYHLPDQSGIDLVTSIRGDERLAPTPVLMLGGSHHAFDAAEARAAGVDAVITKPFTTDSLLEAVSEATTAALERAKATVEPPLESQGPDLQPDTQPAPGFRRLAPTAPEPPAASGFRRASSGPPAPPLAPPGQQPVQADELSVEADPIQMVEAPPVRETSMEIGREHLIPESQSDAYLIEGIELDEIEEVDDVIEIEHDPPTPPDPASAAATNGVELSDDAAVEAGSVSEEPAVASSTTSEDAQSSPDSGFTADDLHAAVSEVVTPAVVQQAVISVLTADIIREAVRELVSNDTVRMAVDAKLEATDLDAIMRPVLPDLIKATLPAIVKEYLATMLRSTGEKLEAYSARKIDEFCETDLPRLAAEAIKNEP